MADVTETRQLYDPQLEGSRTAYLKSLDTLGAGLASQLQGYSGLDTSKFAPQIADQNILQTQAVDRAAGLGALRPQGAQESAADFAARQTAYDAQVDKGLAGLVGADAYKAFMSPYQEEVMQTTLQEFDRQEAIKAQGLRDQAISRGAYGGGREGVMAAEQARTGASNRAQLQAQLLAQGFEQANQAAANQLAAQQGLGGYQQAMGQSQQGFEQAKLDAAQIAAREAQYQPWTQMGLIGQGLAQMTPGTMPIQTETVSSAPQAPISPLQSFIGGAGAVGGILGKILG